MGRVNDGRLRRTPWVIVLPCLFLLPSLLAAAAESPLAEPGRAEEVVWVSGSALPGLAGAPISDFGLFRYDLGTASFVPIPFQVDQRFLKVFDPGLPTQFSEVVYDVFGEDNGLFDAEDELVFVFGDAGVRAPLDGSWVDGAGDTRFEIRVIDPRPVNPEPPRYVYLYLGPGLPESPLAYVDWNGQPDGIVTTDAFQVEFTGNWLTTGFRVFDPCGSGVDLIDRFKGRAEPGLGLLRQDEEDWSENSTYLGGIAGPVRAIRYVRGARSGVNTILRDVIERDAWTRNINLRVHPVDSVWVYFDWLPVTDARLFTPNHPLGLSVDGVPDAGVSTVYTPWHLVKTSAGGAFLSWTVPQSTLYASREFHYLDDAAFNDIVPSKTVYPDDDDASIGSHGVKIRSTLDSNVNPIQIGFRVIPLCAGEGDLNLALSLQEKVSLPPVPEVVPQSDCEAVRTVLAFREGSDLRLSWQGDPTADGFRVYVSSTPGLDRAAWTSAGETVLPTFVDPGGATGADRYYSVVCTADGAEGPW
jgi:hypothetical protein